MGYRTITTTYEPVQATREHRGKCPACGKTTVRRQTFQQTISPFNRNDDGTVRTHQEVWKAVNAKADEWVPDFRHNTEKCQAGDPA